MTIYQLLPGVGGSVGEEGVYLLGGRRQADEIEIGAADQCAAVRGRGRRQPFRLEFAENEPVYRVLDPGAVFHRGRLDISHRLPGPVPALLLQGRLLVISDG